VAPFSPPFWFHKQNYSFSLVPPPTPVKKKTHLLPFFLMGSLPGFFLFPCSCHRDLVFSFFSGNFPPSTPPPLSSIQTRRGGGPPLLPIRSRLFFPLVLGGGKTGSPRVTGVVGPRFVFFLFFFFPLFFICF